MQPRIFSAPEAKLSDKFALFIQAPIAQGKLADLKCPFLGSKVFTSEMLMDLRTILDLSDKAVYCINLMICAPNRDRAHKVIWDLISDASDVNVRDCGPLGSRLFDKVTRIVRSTKDDGTKLYTVSVGSMYLADTSVEIDEYEFFGIAVALGMRSEDLTFAIKFRDRYKDKDDVNEMLSAVVHVLEEV